LWWAQMAFFRKKLLSCFWFPLVTKRQKNALKKSI
jgi:hypothetical protein